MFVQTVKHLDLDLTNRCNAKCPQCPRFDVHYRLKPGLNKDSLSIDLVESKIDKSIFENCRIVLHSGTTGEPTMNPEIFPIIDYYQKCNPNIITVLHTNGDTHDPDWWYKFGLQMKNTTHEIQFGIDGLSDTHALYRVNTKYERILENAKAFIKSGGTACWQYIIFKHNQHQVLEAREVAQKIGFQRFKPLVSNRFLGRDTHKVTHKGKTWILEPTTAYPQPGNTDVDIKSKKNCISCGSLNNKEVYIYPDGTVWPCYFLGGYHKWGAQMDPHTQIDWSIIKREMGGIPSIHDDTLANILKSKHWHKWQFVLKGYLHTCRLYCTEGVQNNEWSDVYFGEGYGERRHIN